MEFPDMYQVRQKLEAPRIDDVPAAVSEELAALSLSVSPGARIAVTAGSRGIRHIDLILKSVVAHLVALGGAPFIVPAMGSHGGGTAEGQADILRSLNISEETMGVPVRSSVETVDIGISSHGHPVRVDRIAAGADGLVVVNRIKPHTDFEGPVESGLMKMMAIGLGNPKGCFEVHKQTVNYGYSSVIPEIGAMILEKLPVLCGLGIVENIHDYTAMVRACRPEDFRETETRLLEQAKSLMARLPFDNLDVLIVDEMGKNISGTGMDTNVIGRIMFIGEPEPKSPKITRIVVLGLTPVSHGNAIGIGLADFTTRSVTEQVNRQVTAFNAITAMTPEKARLPVSLDTDREAVEAALNTIGAVPPDQARIVHIRNTLELDVLHISEALCKEAAARGTLEILERVGPLGFDGDGRIQSRIQAGGQTG